MQGLRLVDPSEESLEVGPTRPRVVFVAVPIGVLDRIARAVEAELQALPGVRSVFMNVGRGNPSVYYNVTQRPEQANLAEALVVLEKFEPRRTPALRDSLQARLDRIPNARIQVRAFENGPPLDAPVALRLVGPDLDTLRLLAGRTQELFDRTAGLTGVHNPFERKATDLRVVIDRNKAGLLGIATAEIDRTIRIGLAGLEVGSVRESDGTDYGIRVRLRDQSETIGLDGAPRVELLDRLKLLSSSGRIVPLGQLTRTRFEASVPLIQHYNRERTVTVTANVRNGFNTDRITREVLAQVIIGGLLSSTQPPATDRLPVADRRGPRSGASPSLRPSAPPRGPPRSQPGG